MLQKTAQIPADFTTSLTVTEVYIYGWAPNNVLWGSYIWSGQFHLSPIGNIPN